MRRDDGFFFRLVLCTGEDLWEYGGRRLVESSFILIFHLRFTCTIVETCTSRCFAKIAPCYFLLLFLVFRKVFIPLVPRSTDFDDNTTIIVEREKKIQANPRGVFSVLLFFVSFFIEKFVMGVNVQIMRIGIVFYIRSNNNSGPRVRHWYIARKQHEPHAQKFTLPTHCDLRVRDFFKEKTN